MLFKKSNISNYYKSSFQKRVLRKNIDQHIFLVCAPKSGSTWLSKILENLLEWKTIPLASSFGYREQEIDISTFLSHNPKGNVLSPHLHCRYSKYTEEIINALDSYVILQVRDIFDTIVSFKDHCENESVIFPSGYMNEEIWAQLPENEKWGFIVDLVLPWYFNFYCGWVSSKLYKENKILMVTYNSLRNDTLETIKEINNFINLTKNNSEIEKALAKANKTNIRKNKAKVGRGESLPAELTKKVYDYTKYYPGIDFSPIGIEKLL